MNPWLDDLLEDLDDTLWDIVEWMDEHPWTALTIWTVSVVCLVLLYIRVSP